jgi:hypothetical protein
MRTLGVLFVVSLLSACASRPVDSGLDAEAKLFRPPTDRACVYIVPSSNTTTVSIILDGRKVATLGNENYLRLEMAPGRHLLSVPRTSLVPGVLRDGRSDLTVEAEAGSCYFLRTAWTDAGESWREYRVYWETLSEAEGRRAVNVRWLMLPAP